MADLATVADVIARIGALTPAQAARAPALLADASSLVRSFTRQTFDLVEGDQVVLRPIGTTLRLPQRPVIQVTSVVAVGGGQLPDIPLAGWLFDGIDKVNIDGLSAVVLNLPEWWNDLDGGPNTYRVTYDHGYQEIPPDVVAIVCGMANRVLTAPTLVEGLTGERIGQYGYQYGQFREGTSPGATVRLTAADKQALIDGGYKRRATTIQTSIL